MIANPYLIAERFIGQKEVTGDHDNVFILWCLSTCVDQPLHDEIAWCSAFANAVALIADLPRSHSLGARSWLLLGAAIELADAQRGDVVIFQRGDSVQPGADVIAAPGHVAWYSSQTADHVYVLGGNQHDSVSLAAFPIARVLGVRRLAA